MQAILVLTNCPDTACARQLARSLLEEGLAACVNLLPAVESLYRWQGSIESASEIPLLIKSTARSYLALEQRIAELHPYDVPEIIALNIQQGLPAYMNWLAAETVE